MSLVVVFGFAGRASATAACPIGNDLGTECQVNSLVTIAGGTYNFSEDLHVTSTGHIDVATGAGGATFNINTVAGLDLIVDGGGIIEAQDDQGGVAPCGTGGGNGPPAGNSACPLTFVTTGDVVLKAGSLISTNELNDGGSSADVNFTVGGNMTMCGPAGAHAGCGGPSGNVGAKILAEKLGDTGGGLPGNVNITVGNIANATGDFYMEGGSTTYGAETGAIIDTTAKTPAGDITITAGHSYFTEPGSVVQAGGHDQTATGQGGKIYIKTGCVLTSEGRVTSKGPDFGADLVHLEGCDVIVRGLVESTGKGHVVDAKNSCDGVDDGLLNEVFRPDHAANSTGCVEIWGKNVTIDATGQWTGEVNADVGDGGSGGTSWIDLFAISSLTVKDSVNNDRDSDNLSGHIYHSTYAVHANSVDGSDGSPGQVRAYVKSGPLTASQTPSSTLGGVFEASPTLNSATGHGTVNTFAGNGSAGGTIDLQASGNVTLDTSWLNAAGTLTGTPPPGGHILAYALGAGSNMSWQNGWGNVNPATGDIKLNACPAGTINTTGTNFNGETPIPSANCGGPTLPSYANDALNADAPIWDLCTRAPSFSISGTKHKDTLAGAGLPGWTIRLYDMPANTLNPQSPATTDGNGNYVFNNLPAGQYKLCEVKQLGWTQTAPNPGTATCTAVDEAPNGIAVTIGPSSNGNDFANTAVADCKEDPGSAAKMTRVVDSTGKSHGPAPVYSTIQAAYNAAANTGEVIGVFTNSTENLDLGGAKTLTITQCELAKVTAADNSKPVWWLHSSGKLTIIGPDSVGGTVGWQIDTANQTIKSVRAYNASQYGVWIKSNGNSASFNEVAGSPVGIQVDGNSNTLKSGTIQKNGTGVVLAGTSDTLDGSTVGPNTGNGVVVNGPNNTVKGVTATQNGLAGLVANGTGTLFDSNKARKNTGNGFTIASTATGTKLKGNSSNDGNQGGSNENGGFEYGFATAITNQGSNKINNTAFTAVAAGNYD